MAERSQAQRDADAIGNGVDRNPSDSPTSIDLPRRAGAAVYDQSAKEHWRSPDRPRVGPFPTPQSIGKPIGLSKMPGEE